VAETISGWGDISVFTATGQRELLLLLLLKGSVETFRRQISSFRVLLTVIAAIIMALILYTLTLDKIHSIASLKLIGASNTVIQGLILQQALILGIVGFGIAYLVGQHVSKVSTAPDSGRFGSAATGGDRAGNFCAVQRAGHL